MEKSSMRKSALVRLRTNSQQQLLQKQPEQHTQQGSVSTSANAHEAPLVSGNLWKAIWVMSWPLLVATMATSLVDLVNVQVAGRLGSASQAAVGLAEQIIFIFQVFLLSVGVGTTAIVSRAYGRNDKDDVDFATAQSLSLSIMIGLALTAVALLSAHFVIPLLSQEAEMSTNCNLYLSIFALYLVPFSFVCIANAAFRAIGNARIPLVIISTEVIINIAGDYLTVVHNFPTPGLGVRGIAGSAVVGALVASIMAFMFLRGSQLKESLRQLLPLSAPLLNRIVNIGVPAALQRLSWGLSVCGLFFILSKVEHPTAALAAWTIGMRIEGMLFLPEMALSMAVSSIVGQNLGANRIDRAFRAGWAVTGIGAFLMGTVGIAIFAFARELAASMNAHDAATMECTTMYLQINAFGAVSQAVNAILSGALQGAGDTKATMWISIVCNWLIRLPLAWVLAVHMQMGANGAWIAMATSATLAAIAVSFRFKSGGWIGRKI
ncbi:MAG: MATE family efflux transporter [Cyanobacteria bacterium SZAS-4]|nr:MATE family efflux transporter [Cyanobacteria bacterium SZAS-4]